MERFSKKYGITFDLLSDRRSVVIRQFGILNTVIDPDDPRAGPFYGIPYPGTYVVDEAGVVTEKFFNRHYATRTSAGTVLDTALGRVLAREETPRASRNERLVNITAFLSDKALTLEVLNTLHVRLELGEGLHVYGDPLPEGFYPTTVVVEPTDGIRVGEPIYPTTSLKRFEVLDVTLPVYEGVVDIMVPITRTAELERLLAFCSRLGFSTSTVELEIEVDYQACSETICYRPETASLSVRVPLANLVMPELGQ